MGDDKVVDIQEYGDTEWCGVCDCCNESDSWRMVFKTKNKKDLKLIRCMNCGNEVIKDEESDN